MTPQEIIQAFMAELNANNYSPDTTNVGTKIFDDAVRGSSKFTSAQDVVDAMKADQIAAEKLAVEEVLGSDYAGKTISEISSSILNASAVTYNDAYKKSNIYINDYISYDSYGLTVEKVIKERKAEIFLKDYCGIVLEKKYWISGSNYVTSWGNDSGKTGNYDTGAITGSDANLTLKVGDSLNGAALTAEDLTALKSKYGDKATLTGDTLIIGTGVEKTAESVVPEEGDMYLFTAQGSAKNINTGSNGWVVNATTGDDTITSDGRDSINASAGNDKITVNSDEATVTTGAGNDIVEISASVKSVTVTDLDSSDTIKISGTFEIGNAQIENSMLVVTDKTGTRKIKFSDLTNVGNAKIGSQKISDWLSNAGFNINNLSSGDVASGDVTSGEVSADTDAGRVTVDADYTLNVDFANQEAVEQTQTISDATNINLGDVTISSGTVKAGNSIVGTVESVSPAVMNFTTNGLTIHVGDGTAESYNALTDAQKMMVAALFKWWAKDSLTLDEDSCGIGFESNTAKVNDIKLTFQNLGDALLALVESTYRGGDEQTVQLELKINTRFYNSYTAGDKNGISSDSSAGYLDRTLAHELTHAITSTNINNFKYLPEFITEGMAELTHGIDDERGNEIFTLAFNDSSLASALAFTSGTGHSVAYSGGYMFLRYFARQAALQTLNDNFLPGDITATVNLSSGNGTYYVSGNSTLETATTSPQAISLGSANGSTYTVGDTSVYQNINTGDTAKNIVNVNHKVSVTGGAGNDTIQFVEGTFIDAGNGDNSIVGSGKFAAIKAGTGNDSVLVNGASNLLMLGDGNNLVSLVNADNSTTYNNTIQTGDGNDTVRSSEALTYESQINLGNGDNVIYLAARNSTIQTGDGADSLNFIYGNDSENKISLGAGNDSVFYAATNNTLDMGAGDDYVHLNGGYNYFLFNADSGNDTIRTFQATDKLVIEGDYSVTTEQVYSNGYSDFVVSIIKDDDVVGTIKLKGAVSSFSSVNNIIAADVAEEIIEENPLLISLTAGADEYANSVAGATIKALAGDDTIANEYSFTEVLIDGGAGNDSIYNEAEYVSIKAGTGNDSITNYGSNTSIDGGNDDDVIDNVVAFFNTISSGAGNDSITNYGILVTEDEATDALPAGFYVGDSLTLDGGDGDDVIENMGSAVSINGGAGNDSIANAGEDVTISAGDGNDTISNEYTGFNASIEGGTGDDSILNEAENVTFNYAVGDGDDTIMGFTASSTLKIGNGRTDTYSRATVGNDILISVSAGSILLKDAASLAAVNISGTDGTPQNPDENPLLISLSAGNDNYTVSTEGATIKALAGDDTVTNFLDNVSIDGGADNDYIDNSGSNVSIDAGAGYDFVRNYGNNVSIDGGDDSDFIANVVGIVNKISGGKGNDSISNYGIMVDASVATADLPAGFYVGDSLTLDGGEGDDVIENDGASVSISGGAGNDNIANSGASVSIDAGDGSDTIENYGANVSVDAGDGSDIIENSGANVSIDGNTGNDFVTNTGLNVKIDAGDGADTVKNDSGSNVSIDGGRGNDSIANIAVSVTVDGGDDFDIIQNYGYYSSISGGQGNDTLSNVIGSYNTVSGDAGNDIIVNYGINLDASAGVQAGYYVGNNLTLDGGAGNDKILNRDGSNILINGGAGNDSITNTNTEDGMGEFVSIDGGAGNDSISNTAVNVSINAGDGADIIKNFGANVSIDGGLGNDSISIGATNVTIDGGAGNDSIISNGDGGNTYLFDAAGGKDTVTGYGDNDTIKIADNGAASVSVSGNNIVVNVGRASLTLKDAANGTHVNVVNADGETLVDQNFYADRSINGNGMTLTSAFKDQTFTADESINAVDASATTNKFTLSGGDENDTLIGGKGANFINGNGGENILTGGKGNDTFIAGNGTDTITDYSVSGTNGADKISLTSAIKDFSIDGRDIVLNFDDGKSLTIQDGYGKKINFIQNGKSVTQLFENEGIFNSTKTAITLAADTDDFTADTKLITIDGGLTDSVWIVGNAKANKIFGGDGDDTINGGTNNDTLTGGAGNDIFVYDAGKDVITDYVSDTDKISLGAATTSESLNNKGNVVLKFGTNSLTINKVDDTDGRTITFTGDDGDTTKTYFSEKIVGNDGVTLQSAYSSNTYTATNDLPKVDASALSKKLTLTGGDEDNTLIGGKGADMLNGNAGDDLLFGKGGADTFVYSSGNDTIGDYGTGADKISLTSAIKNFDLSGDDVIIGFDSDSLTIAGMAGKKVTFVENVDGKVKTQVNVFTAGGMFNSEKTAVTLSADATNFTADTKLITIDGGLVTDDTEIVGNAKANKIYAGIGGTTINGGKGNDTLWGGDGSDTFVYENGGGRDVIYGFGNNDSLNIDDDFTATVKENSIAFKVGTQTNAITLKDYTATELTINGDTYQISGNTLARR